MKFIIALLTAYLALASSIGADAPAESRPITFAPATTTLRQALAQLRQQSGNVVHDARQPPTDLPVAVPARPGTFWPALDALGKAAGVGLSLYPSEGGVALVDAPYRAVPTAYSGLFRITARRVSVTRDEETGAHTGTIALDAAWEPRFEPFYLDAGTVTVRYADAAGQARTERASAGGQLAVAGRGAVEIDLRFPAPPRRVPKIAALEGSLTVIGPTRMLDFTFDKLAADPKGERPRSSLRDGVSVTVSGVRLDSTKLTVTLAIENPPGPELESFQSWLSNNRVVLVPALGGLKDAWPAEASTDEVRGRRAEVSYYFPLKGRRVGAAGLAAWTLHVRTPGPIVRLDVPFRLTELPLP